MTPNILQALLSQNNQGDMSGPREMKGPDIPPLNSPPPPIVEHKDFLKGLLSNFMFSLGQGLTASSQAPEGSKFGAGLGGAIQAPEILRQRSLAEQRQLEQMQTEQARQRHLAEQDAQMRALLQPKIESLKAGTVAKTAQTAELKIKDMLEAFKSGRKITGYDEQGVPQFENLKPEELSEVQQAGLWKPTPAGGQLTNVATGETKAGPVKFPSLAEKQDADIIQAYATKNNIAPEQVTPEMRVQARTLNRVGNSGNFAGLFIQKNGRFPTPEEMTAYNVKVRQAYGDLNNLTPAAQAMLARAFLSTGTLPALGMGSQGLRTAIMNGAAFMDPAADIGTSQALFTANKNSLAALQKMADNVNAWSEGAEKNIQLLLKTAKPIVDSGSPWINTPLRAVDRNALGNADMLAYNAARQVAVNEVARVVSNPNLVGVLSDTARKEVSDFIPENATLEQVVRVADVLRQDMLNRKTSLNDQINEIKKRVAVPGANVQKAISGPVEWERGPDGKPRPKKP